MGTDRNYIPVTLANLDVVLEQKTELVPLLWHDQTIVEVHSPHRRVELVAACAVIELDVNPWAITLP